MIEKLIAGTGVHGLLAGGGNPLSEGRSGGSGGGDGSDTSKQLEEIVKEGRSLRQKYVKTEKRFVKLVKRLGAAEKALAQCQCVSDAKDASD